MRYFIYEQDEDTLKQEWENSQFLLADVVLFLTDRKIVWGQKIYNIFINQEVQHLLNCFSVDFNQIKKDLGLDLDYVERGGNVFSHSYNPKRNFTILSSNGIEYRAMMVYETILKDLEKICEKLGCEI